MKKVLIASVLVIVSVIVSIGLLLFYIQAMALPAEYTIRYNTNGGTRIDPVVISENDILTPPNEPIKEGYTFISWYEDEDLTIVFDFNEPIDRDYTLYVKWEEQLE